jgi:hypothetical protein
MTRAASSMIACAALCACDISDPMRYVAPPECAPLIAAGGPLYADLSCQQPVTTASVIQDGCNVSIRLSSDRNVTITGELAESGSLVLDPSDQIGLCQPVTGPDAAVLSLSCSQAPLTCRIDLYPTVDRADMYATRTLSADDQSFRAPEREPDRFLSLFDPLGGWLGGTALLGADRMVVARHGRWDDPRCVDTSTSSLAFVDLDDFEIDGAVSGPPCTVDLASVAGEDEFYAAFGGRSPMIGRFDREGRMIATATLAANGQQFLADLHAEAGRLYALVSSDDGPAYSAILSLPDLKLIATSSTLEDNVRMLLPARTGVLAIADVDHGSVVLLRDSDLLLSGELLLMTPGRSSSNDTGAMFVDPESGLLLVSTTGPGAALYTAEIARPQPTLSEGMSYETIAAPWAISGSPRAGEVLVGMTESAEPHRASLAIFHPRSARFLPGTLPIGRGVVRELHRHANGRLYAVLPWEATIVEIELLHGARSSE